MTRSLRRIRDALLLFVFFALMAIIAARLDRPREILLDGPFFAIDGDTLSSGRERLRLAGLDAPERDQTCRDADGREWACGTAARRRLAQLASGTDMACRSTGRDVYRRLLVHCRKDGRDINAMLVEEGMAVAYGDYRREEEAARTNRRGIWAGDFDQPKIWRETRGRDAEPGLLGALGSWLGW